MDNNPGLSKTVINAAIDAVSDHPSLSSAALQQRPNMHALDQLV